MYRLFILIVLISVFKLQAAAGINPVKLTCEYLENPSVVDVLQPRLSWINEAGREDRGQFQSAWQVRVASSKEQLAEAGLWDSGKVESEQSTRIKYAGKALSSGEECWWQVRVWDKNGAVSGWSEPGFWRMGLLDVSDWKATWIGAPWQGEEALPKPVRGTAENMLEDTPPPAPMLRKEFNIQKEVKSAVAFVTGLGYFELYLNGGKVGNDVLVPNQTNYGKRPDLVNQFIAIPDNFREYRVMYLAYDVKDQLKSGANCVGSILGNGFYNPAKHWAEGYGTPRFLMQLQITYTDGSKETVVSDKSWKASKSPILMDMVYYGEQYDARLEQPGWCTAGFDDSNWKSVAERKAPEGKLVAHTARPDKVVERIQPVSIRKSKNGSYVIDFGVEVSGWVRLNNVEGPAGHKVEIRFLSNLYSGDNSYIFNGKGKENYAARFNWFVFRKVKVINWPGELKAENITAEVVNTQIEESSVFETSNTMFNNINKIWRRSQTDNMHGGIASDCPHRERSPYTGDGQVSCVTVMHNFDARNFYYKWIHDIIGAQEVESGYVPNSAPWQPGCGGGVAWGAAINIMPWEFYLHYGDKDILEDAYPAMKEYIRYMQTWVDKDGIMFSQRTGKDGKVQKWFNLGDWVPPGDLPPDDMVHTFYFWRCADLTSKTARVIGNTEEAERYHSLAENTRKAFWKRFYNSKEGSYGPAGGDIFALKMGVPAEQYQKVIAALKKNIQKNHGHLDTGIFGTQFFFEVLAENGMQDLAYQALNKTDKPGYGHWLELGSTTTRENWDKGGSHNHPMFGGGLVWFYQKLAGMQTDEDGAGYRHIIFKPQPVDDLSRCKYFTETPLGEAGIDWQQKGPAISMKIKVPVGSRATVYVPVSSEQTTIKNIKEFSDAVKEVGWENGYRILETGSGDYDFVVQE